MKSYRVARSVELWGSGFMIVEISGDTENIGDARFVTKELAEREVARLIKMEKAGDRKRNRRYLASR